MHLYMITRGIKHEVDQFITELQGKYLPFKWRDAGKGETKLSDCFVQLSVRPIQLWEVVFPEEHKEVVLATCLGNEGKKGKPYHKWQEKYVNMFRKLLKLEPIPDYNITNVMPVRRQGIECVGIGLKTDYWTALDGSRKEVKEDGAFEAL